MATTIQNIPDELLVEILGELVRKDLKSARLVCTLWSTAGAKWMFQRVYFAPRKTSMELFTNIAANPAFARNVKELIYDGRLFLPQLGTFGSYYLAFCARAVEEVDLYEDAVRYCLFSREANFAEGVYHDSIWNRGMLGPFTEMKTPDASDLEGFRADAGISFARYTRLLQQQENIFTKGKDLKALNEGLNSFRNITKVSVVVDFAHCLEYDLHAGDRDDQYIEHHRWYSSRSYTELGFAVPPSQWCPEPDSQEQQWSEDRKWEVRGVHNLFRAISMHCQRLRELRIGSTQYKAPMTIFQLSNIETEKIAAVARNLTTLGLYPYVTKGHDGSEYAKQYGCLGQFLQEAKGLRNLSSSGCISDYEGSDASAADDDEYLVWNERTAFGPLLGKQWPYLTKLTLKAACVEARDLMTILRAHTESLRELRLVHIYLYGKERWDHLGTEIGQILKLHFVSICGLYNGELWAPNQTWSRGEQGFLRIRDMMQWVPPSLLEIEAKSGIFTESTFEDTLTGRLKASLKTDC